MAMIRCAAGLPTSLSAALSAGGILKAVRRSRKANIPLGAEGDSPVIDLNHMERLAGLKFDTSGQSAERLTSLFFASCRIRRRAQRSSTAMASRR
jgi:hypothetical protein